jgi:glycosyltransferase involved in cell wall biosynthesis
VLGFFTLAFGFCIVVIGIYFRKQRKPNEPPRLVWGPTPLINNKYWSNALKRAGYESVTLMQTYYSISEKEDFDKYWDELVPKSRWGLLNKIYKCLSPYVVFVYAIRNSDIVHHSFAGGFLANTGLKKLEAVLLKKAGCKIVIIGYGADHYQYSQVTDRSLLHGLLSCYPQQAHEEEDIRDRVSYWTKHADVILGGYGSGSGRWDALPVVTIAVDVSQWQPRREYSQNNGKNGKVIVIHTPNHRAFKGTEFLVQAVEELREEGLMVELIIVENRPNTEVRRLISEKADILAEQFIASTYALSGIEGMVSGLPVLANLDHEGYTLVFRRYSYLNECPILSTPPERLKENLKLLVINPQLREELGRAGRRYVEKYHSEETAKYLFGSIYDKIWYGKDVELMDLFHPLKSEYNRQKPMVQHPLVENRLPKSYFSSKASGNS